MILERDPVAMADACLAVWATPSELQRRHDAGNHEWCPPTWCEHVTDDFDYMAADVQQRHPDRFGRRGAS